MEDNNMTKNGENKIGEELIYEEETSEEEEDLLETSEKSENEDECDYEVQSPFVKIDGVTDLILQVDSTWFYVNKGILISCSPVFKDMICSTDTSVLKLDDNKYNLLSFLQSLYPSILAPVTMQNIGAVLQLSFKYEVAALIQKCERNLEDYFQQGNGTFDQLIEKLQMAEKYKLAKAQIAGLKEVLKNNCSTVDNKPITNELKRKIMAKRLEMLESVVQQFARSCSNCSSCKYSTVMTHWNNVNNGTFCNGTFSVFGSTHMYK